MTLRKIKKRIQDNELNETRELKEKIAKLEQLLEKEKERCKTLLQELERANTIQKQHLESLSSKGN